MAIYICDECGEFKDDDYFPYVEHPNGGDFCCEECDAELEEASQQYNDNLTGRSEA